MRIRSHLDPTLFVIFIHINTREYDGEFRDLVRSFGWGPGTDLDPLLSALKERDRRTMAHERFHFWQGLRLPFLNLHATLNLRAVLQCFRKMAKASQDWRRWSDLGWTISGFDRLDRHFVLSADRKGHLAFGQGAAPGYDFSLRFSSKEMLECGASIFDFQSSCEEISNMSDPESLDMWSKLNPAYFRILKFYEEFLGSKYLAIRTILPLINAAFHTSFPERALLELMARVWGTFAQPQGGAETFLSQKEPCRWSEVFQSWLSELDYDFPFGTCPDQINLDGYEYYYLDPNRWLGGSIGGAYRHPFLGPSAIEWQAKAKTVSGLNFYLDQPGYVANPEAHKFAFAAEPQLRIVRAFLEDGSDRVFPVGDGLVGPAFHDSAFSNLSASEFRGLILDIFASYSVFRRSTGAQMTDASQTCYHRACPYFEINYCNAYPLIPQRFEDCGFPTRINAFIREIRNQN